LKHYPVESLSDDDLLVVETNISSYNMLRGAGKSAVGYSLSLRSIFFLGEGSNASNQASPRTLKRPGDSLVSPRKNKKAGDIAVFSDEDGYCFGIPRIA